MIKKFQILAFESIHTIMITCRLHVQAHTCPPIHFVVGYSFQNMFSTCFVIYYACYISSIVVVLAYNLKPNHVANLLLNTIDK